MRAFWAGTKMYLRHEALVNSLGFTLVLTNTAQSSRSFLKYSLCHVSLDVLQKKKKHRKNKHSSTYPEENILFL